MCIRDSINTNARNIGTNANAITFNAAGVANNAGNINANADNIGFNANAITVNANGLSVNARAIQSNGAAITSNSREIVLNQDRINSNSTLIDRNFALGLSNQSAIGDLRQGLASVAALPDIYLSPKAKWSAAGGLGFYGGETAIGAALSIRGNDNWAIGGSISTGSGESSGKVQVRYEGF